MKPIRTPAQGSDARVERPIDFHRDRHFLCTKCGHRWTVDLDWIERWAQGHERCPGCGVDCTEENAPRVTVDPNDPALVDENVPRFSWYHTSTHADWPPVGIDPAAGLTPQTRLMMGGDARVAAWADRQRAKALHVGTYEAAIHNMLRRLDDQGDDGKQFYPYRVHLRQDIVVRESWLIDPSNFVGDVELAEVCPPGIDVARYLNYHEDPGGLSLALGRDAIAATQQVAIPTATNLDEDWATSTTDDIRTATEVPPRPMGMHTARVTLTPEMHRAQRFAEELSQTLPVNLREQFRSALGYRFDADPDRWVRSALELVTSIVAPNRMLTDLAGQAIRAI